jgi:hypothetical protein
MLVTATWAVGRGLSVWPQLGDPWIAPVIAYLPMLGHPPAEPAQPTPTRLAKVEPGLLRRPSHVSLAEWAAAPPATAAPMRVSDEDQLRQEIAFVGRYGTPPSMARLLFTGNGSGKTVLAPPGARAERQIAAVPRLSVSGWAIARGGGGGASLAGAGQLGGSQAGLRASYGLDKTRSIALFGRASSPLSSPGGREVALGIDWQPLRDVPVRIAAERRQSIGGGRNAFGLGLFGGINPTRLGHGFSLDAYGQAGVVGVRRRDGYIDGAIRIERGLADVGGMQIAVGAGSWGGIQPGVRRLDIGPQIVARVPVAGARLRIGLDWRQRVAGNARPGSGPALSIGTDF